MEDVTVQIPSVGLEAYFTFKEPFNNYLRAKFNLDSLAIKLKVVSIISMRDAIRNDLRDPFTEIYLPVGLTDLEYKKDLLDEIPLISFSFTDLNGVTRFFRCPLNYISSIENISNIEYINKLIIVDMNRLPVDLDLTVFFNDISDFIRDRYGVEPQIKEVGIGEVEFVTQQEHDSREAIRTTNVTVYKTLLQRLAEVNLKYDQLLQRLQQLNITLG